MDVENLSKSELLTLFSVLEGELEAQDVVIEVLKAQQRDAFVEERYGTYDPSDPFLALHRDKEMALGPDPKNRPPPGLAPYPSPLAVLQLVVTHCKKMQQKMLAQLAAAESRHRKVIADLEEEKQRHAQDTADGDDVTYMLEKERERLVQQLEFEKAQVRRLDKEQRRLSIQAEEERVQHRKLSASLAKECQRAAARAVELNRELEEERMVTRDLRAHLEEERIAAQDLRAQLEEEHMATRSLRAQLEEERNRLRAPSEEQHELLQMQLQQEKRCYQELLAELEGHKEEGSRPGGAQGQVSITFVASQTEEGNDLDTSASFTMNGHHVQVETDASSEKHIKENGHESVVLRSPISFHSGLSPSTSGSSPCSSPVLAKKPVSYQSSYQAGINQRFHAARHKFQGSSGEEVLGSSTVRTPWDMSPSDAPAEPGTVKQLARHTVTQVLSRFTCQQSSPKPASPSSSPFGTDYRNLATASPVASKFPSSLPHGVKSPTLSRTERGNPPPIPPKKPGLAQCPASPRLMSRTSHFPELSSTCGLSSSQEDTKERGLVMSSTS